MHETLGSNWREICPILLVSIHYIKPMKQVFVTVECFHFSMKPILWDEKCASQGHGFELKQQVIVLGDCTHQYVYVRENTVDTGFCIS